MSKITRISAALALMVAVVSGCKSNNNTYPDGAGCGCTGTPGAVTTGVGTPVTTTHAPVGMTSPTSGAMMGSPMPTGSSSFAPSTTSMGGQYPGR